MEVWIFPHTHSTQKCMSLIIFSYTCFTFSIFSHILFIYFIKNIYIFFHVPIAPENSEINTFIKIHFWNITSNIFLLRFPTDQLFKFRKTCIKRWSKGVCWTFFPHSIFSKPKTIIINFPIKNLIPRTVWWVNISSPSRKISKYFFSNFLNNLKLIFYTYFTLKFLFKIFNFITGILYFYYEVRK